MKNPLEYTMLECEAIMRGDPDAPQTEFTHLLAYIRFRQNTMHLYEVKKELAKVEAPREISRRKSRSMDADLLAECVLITLEDES